MKTAGVLIQILQGIFWCSKMQWNSWVLFKQSNSQLLALLSFDFRD